jgi:hypothetical protein
MADAKSRAGPVKIEHVPPAAGEKQKKLKKKTKRPIIVQWRKFIF